jgi:asparagine synthase (glutamine-hydrolysing)
MCGIAGIASHESSAALVVQTERMLARLAHRGPDDAGMLVFSPRESLAFTLDRNGRRESLEPPADGSCATVVLGNRRLSIIDLTSAGHQPMRSLDDHSVVTFNGEIYNYLELRRELETLGHRFVTRSDTEVLLAAFGEWGLACLSRLIGMFAVAVLDRPARRLILARDPFGMKPLFYVTRPGTLAFASEIPPLLPLLGGRPHAGRLRVREYLESGLTDHAAETMFAGVQVLPAAHAAIVDLERPDQVTPIPYWRPDLGRTLEISFPEAAARLRELFLEGVSLHLRSDVPMGVLVSGGIDSSAVVMAMRRLGGPNLDIHTFSYIGSDGAVSEEPWIDLVNQAAGAVPHKIRLEPRDWTADADSLIESQGEPFGSVAIHAQNRLFRCVAAAGVKVTLDGQGGDELLGGYASHLTARLSSLLEQGRWMDGYRLLRGIAHQRRETEPTVRQIVRAAIRTLLPGGLRTALRAIPRSGRRPWLDAAWSPGDHATGDPFDANAQRGLRLRHALWRSLRKGTLPALVRYADRSAMAYSVESRLPFLTPRLAEFVLALPEDYLVGRDATRKRAFREAMRGIVPDPILERRDKVGFAVPVRSWLPAIPELLEALQFAVATPPVEKKRLEPYLAELHAGRELSTEMTYLMWRLATFALWVRRFDVALD